MSTDSTKPPAPFTPAPYVAEQPTAQAHSDTAYRTGQANSDYIHRPIPPRAFKVGGGSRAHGLIATILGGGLVAGFLGVPMLMVEAGEATVIFHLPIVIGAVLLIGGLAMLVKGGEK